MHATAPIRRWQRLGLCSLLCLAVPGLALAQSQTSTQARSTPPKKPAQTSSTPAKKSTQHPSGQATS